MCSQNICPENEQFKVYKSTLLGSHDLLVSREEKIRKDLADPKNDVMGQKLVLPNWMTELLRDK
jgi:hypothetical protein